MTDIRDLEGNPRRRANAVVRGFHYQFWRTVEAWLELDPEDVLFVEGAEDFDRIGVGESTAVQVKDDRASGPLTLNGVKALGALTNFWSLVKDNRGRRIRFKFITTAEAGVEGDAFEGQKGLELWNLCARSPLAACSDSVARIQSFLIEKKSLDRRLLEFLETASVEATWGQLIEPFEWLYDEPALGAVREIIVGRLLELGRDRGLTAKDAARLADQLHMMVVDAAIERTPKPLTFITFREQLDQAVNLEIPRQFLRQRAVYGDAVNQLVTSSAATGEGELPTLTSVADVFAAPVLGSGVWTRRELLERVRSGLAAGVVLVDGSAGMGKTTLVRQAVDGKEPLLWAGFRDSTVSEVVEICRNLIEHVAKARGEPTVVLDDLNPEGDPRRLEDCLGRLAATMTARHGGLAIISYRPPGPRLASILRLSNTSRVSVEPFGKEDIRQFLMAEGCPEKRAGELARIVGLHTAGHPQLVAARIGVLKAASFSKPTLSDVADQPKDVRDARSEALQVVRSVLPEGARDLLYRLSVAIPLLKRSHVLRIGGANPSIPRTGEMLDNLVGPWLEQPVPDRYRVSALVSRAADEVLSPSEVKGLHAHIATALLAERTLSVSELSGVIAHAVFGEAEAQLALAARIFLTASRGIKEPLAKELSWVAGIGVDESRRLRLASKAARQLFRLFQWEVAGLAAPGCLEALAKEMESDFPSDVDEPGEVFPRVLYLAKLLLEIDFPISPDRIVAYTLELWRLSERAGIQGVSIGSGIPPMYPGLERPILADMFAAVLIPRVRRVEDLRTLVSALDALDTGDRNRLLSGFKTDDGELRLLFNGPWAFMKRTAQGSYGDYARTLEEALSAGRRWGHHPWMRASARTLSALFDEMLNRSEEAERVVTATAREVGPSLNLNDQLAVIAFNHKEYGTALEMWERILPSWEADRLVRDMQPVFSTRCAAIAAAHLGKWDVSADLFGQAIERSPTIGMKPWRVGILADRGYAFWQSGQRKEAVIEFSKAVQALETLPNRPESFAEYAVQKLVGHTLASLASPGSVAAVIPGMCSNLDPSEGIKELPPTPTVYAWFLVYELARQAGSDELAATCVGKFQDVPFAFLRAMAARDCLERRLRSRELEGVIQLAIKTALEMEKSMQRRNVPPQEPDSPELTAHVTEASVATFIRPALWAATIRAKALGLNVRDLLTSWQKEVDAAPPAVVDEVGLWDTQNRMTVGELGAILKNVQESRERRMLAAVLLVGHEDAAIEDALYAQVTVVDGAKDLELLREVAGEGFDALVRRDWLRFCDNPFMLRSPQLYVKMIREACQSSAVGWSTAARIIVAALPTTNLNIPGSLRHRLEEMAKSVRG